MFFIKKLKSCFDKGENNKRHEVLKAISEAIYDEYTEDGFYSRFSWLVEELLIADPSFNKLFNIADMEYLKKGLAQSVDNAKKRLSK